MKKNLVWISGGSTGIGRATTKKFISEGWDVAVTARNFEELKKLKSEIENRNNLNKIYIFQCDIKDIEQVKNIVKLPKQIKKIYPEFTWRMIDKYHDYYTKKDCIRALDNIYKSNEDYYDNFEDHEELLQILCKIDKKIPNINYMTLEKYYGGDISEFPCFN